MNRTTSFLAALLIVSAVAAHPIDYEKARSLAAKYAVSDMPVLHHAARVSRAGSTPPYYVFSRGEGAGYVIVAGDDCLPSILGYTESGDFDEQQEAPQLMAMLDHYANVVETLRAEGRNVPYGSGPSKVSSAVNNRVNVPVMLSSHWHQSSPYNDRAPKLANGNRALTGCVATAGAQVFYYWQRDMPSTLAATTPTYDFGTAPVTAEYQIKAGTPLKWELMRNSYNRQPAEYRDAVAVLMAAVGMHTYLEYGESTGGYIWKLPYDFFNLSWMQANKSDNFTDDMWSALIYSDLRKGHPVIYSGYVESGDGHALVIDGYDASGDLFHFNYGWGGQSDGYYTVREPDAGSNKNIEFSYTPTVIYDIHPKKYNVKVDILTGDKVYAQVSNNITLKVTNKSSIAFSGLHVFTNRNGEAPKRLPDAQSADTETTVGMDQTVELTLTVTPASIGPCYIIVTDDNLNILAKKAINAEEGMADLWVEEMHMEGSTETERHGPDDYCVTYHTKGTAVARIHNKGEAAFEGAMRMRLWRTDDEGASWQEVGMKTGRANLPAGATADVAFSIAGSTAAPVKEGVLYRVTMVRPVPVSDTPVSFEEGCDTVAHFVLHPADLAIDAFEDGVLRLSGHWDPTLFASNTMAGRATYAGATAYDLRGVTSIGSVPRLETNPNALYLVPSDADVKGVNVVRDGVCARLSLMPGYDFRPPVEFRVAGGDISLQEKVGKWCLLTTPFNVQVPDGVIARSIDSHASMGISGRTTDVKMMEAGKTYLTMTSYHANQVLEAFAEGETTPVAMAPAANADPALVGTYANIEAPEISMILNNEDNQKFIFKEEGVTVEALRGYFAAEDVPMAFSASSNATLDPSYRTLALAIDQAYGILKKYRGMAAGTAYDEYLECIKEAEKEFSNREGTTLNTPAKITAYAQELLAKGGDYMRQIEKPGTMEVDFTPCIKNPSFELKNTNGWTLTKPVNPNITATTAAKAYLNSSDTHFTANADGSYILSSSYMFTNEEGVRDTLGVGLSQEVEGLVPGYYRLTALLASDEGNTVTLFAGDKTVVVTAHPFGRHYFAEGVVDSVEVKAVDGGTGTLLIGVAPGKWFKADNFRLTWTGALGSGDTPDAIIETPLPPRPAIRGTYTLQGQRVEHPSRPGIYIIDGKKIVIR